MSLVTQQLAHQIHDAFIHSPHLNQRKMKVQSESGRVIIRGSVRSFFEKQMAQEAVRKIDGVESIENRLEVTWS